ncbi:hypothetical protein K458DRAFT_426981 [Lentithecium fluviatile CBS 122367]|uniref:F-box domain-containing protein n=1 Tax=Lentithecium fluviatile CBS 122367 TaxID=1168545 RepID=A0A6G1JIU5_9PLEO|nr:hypothetical protein K458DRAFT_426981 [Lentithecium fluviatile CBS 122367]
MSRRPSIFERLPEELVLLCLSYCDNNSILNTCLTSKAVFSVCQNYLFYHIDFSVHNDGVWRKHANYINISVPPDHAKAKQIWPANAIITRRQYELLERLNKEPSLGQQTRVLRWTLMDCTESVLHIRDDFNLGTYPLWAAFACFSKITEIDLAFMTGSRELHPPPPSLFSTATSISLAGTVSYSVISSILTSVNPSRLIHLRLNNLQTFREDEEMLIALNAPNIESHRRTRHGALQGFLADLTGRCTALRSFHLLTTAEFFDGSFTSFSQPNSQWPKEVADENRRYGEVGAFIESVKPTLRDLHFEHGPDIDYFSTAEGHRFHQLFPGQHLNDPLPMDVWFDAHVLPVLVSGPWPKLGSLTVKGIGHWKPLDAWGEEATVEEVRWLHGKTAEFRRKAIMIWDAAPEGCKVVVKDEASRPFYRFQADKTVNGKGQA